MSLRVARELRRWEGSEQRGPDHCVLAEDEPMGAVRTGLLRALAKRWVWPEGQSSVSIDFRVTNRC